MPTPEVHRLLLGLAGFTPGGQTLQLALAVLAPGITPLHLGLAVLPLGVHPFSWALPVLAPQDNFQLGLTVLHILAGCSSNDVRYVRLINLLSVA